MSQRNNSRYNSTKCPSCNTVAGSFVKSFLDLDKLGQGLDDISISSDSDSCCSSSSSSDGDNGSNDGFVEKSDHENHCYDDDYDDDHDEDDDDDVTSRDNVHKKSANEQTSSDVILMLDSDSDCDSDIEQEGSDYSVAGMISSSSPSKEFQRKVSICSSNSQTNIPVAKKRRNNNAGGSAGARTESGSKTIMDDKRLEKKYKRLKKQLLAAKETVAKTLEESTQHSNLQVKYQDLKKSHKEMKQNYCDQCLVTVRYESEVCQLKENVETLQNTIESLKKKMDIRSAMFDKEKERLKNMAESIKVGNMEEMKMIIEQNKQLKKQSHEIMKNLSVMSMEKGELERMNKKLQMKLHHQGNTEDLTEQSDCKKSKKTMSRSKIVELFRESLKDAEADRLQEEEEELSLKKQMDRKNMIRKSSSQTSRVLAAVAMQKRVRPMPLPHIPRISGKPFVPTAKPKETKVASSIRKRPGSHDLRNLFCKRI